MQSRNRIPLRFIDTRVLIFYCVILCRNEIFYFFFARENRWRVQAIISKYLRYFVQKSPFIQIDPENFGIIDISWYKADSCTLMSLREPSFNVERNTKSGNTLPFPTMKWNANRFPVQFSHNFDVLQTAYATSDISFLIPSRRQDNFFLVEFGRESSSVCAYWAIIKITKCSREHRW